MKPTLDTSDIGWAYSVLGPPPVDPCHSRTYIPDLKEKNHRKSIYQLNHHSDNFYDPKIHKKPKLSSASKQNNLAVSNQFKIPGRQQVDEYAWDDMPSENVGLEVVMDILNYI